MTDEPQGIVEVLPSEDGKSYFWHLKALNGEIIASSGSERFEHPTDAKAAAERAVEIAAGVTASRVIYREPDGP